MKAPIQLCTICTQFYKYVIQTYIPVREVASCVEGSVEEAPEP